jgi:hypothetical protein
LGSFLLVCLLRPQYNFIHEELGLRLLRRLRLASPSCPHFQPSRVLSISLRAGSGDNSFRNQVHVITMNLLTVFSNRRLAYLLAQMSISFIQTLGDLIH